jgi:pilus assembly protein Flp/PilA
MLQLFTNLQIRLMDLMDRKDERGATAVEYGLLVALIAAVIVVTVGLLGARVELAFTKIVNALPAV